MPAGEFSPSALLAIKLKAEEMWTNSQLAASLQSNTETARAILTNQTATLREFDDPTKDKQIIVNWLNPCGIVAQPCESNCDLTEEELESGAKTYAPDLCMKSGFSVDAEKSRTNTYTVEEIAAQGLAGAIKALDEYWSQQALVKLKAFAGVNVAPAPWTWAAGTTTVPSVDYTVGMIPQLMNQQILNRMPSVYYIDNGGLYVPFLIAQQNAGNLNGQGDAARIAALKLFFDQWNFAPAGLTEDTFMIAPGAVAMKTVNRNPQAPQIIGGQVQQTVYRVASQKLPGVSYDAYYTMKCVTRSGKAHIMHTWRLETNGGIFLNPEGCPVVIGGTTYTPTGVLSYTKGA